MITYSIYIKSHTDAPDFEADFDAENEDQAVDGFHAMLKGEFDKDFIRKSITSYIL